MSGRQRFSPEFKAIAVEEVVEKNRMIADVAREMKVLPGTLGNWVCLYREKYPVVEEPLSLSERAELVSLRREVQDLRSRSEFLGKAAAFFAREFR